jgi:hypothetical protein
MVHGVSHWVGVSKALGNSIVPQCAFTVYQAIAAHQNRMKVAA